MSNKKASMSEERRRRRASRSRWRIALVSTCAAILALAALLFWLGQQRSLAAFDYAPEDISHEQPLTAIHEMGVGPPIPFLPRNGPQPEILISDRLHDFGVIGSTDVVSIDFLIANTGTAPLTISRSYTTCGCTTAIFSGTVIEPGMVSLVTVELDAGFHDVSGQTVRRGLIIENNDLDQSTAEFWIQATVR